MVGVWNTAFQGENEVDENYLNELPTTWWVPKLAYVIFALNPHKKNNSEYLLTQTTE